jgi:hypothetical protein
MSVEPLTQQQSWGEGRKSDDAFWEIILICIIFFNQLGALLSHDNVTWCQSYKPFLFVACRQDEVS